MSAAAVASSMLASNNNDDDRRVLDADFSSFANFSNRDLETVLVFTLEDDTEISMLGLLTEQQVFTTYLSTRSFKERKATVSCQFLRQLELDSGIFC